jgi:hypothetical protein
MSKVDLEVYRNAYDALAKARNAEAKEANVVAITATLEDWAMRRRVEIAMVRGLERMIRHAEIMISAELIGRMKVPAGPGRRD